MAGGGTCPQILKYNMKRTKTLWWQKSFLLQWNKLTGCQTNSTKNRGTIFFKAPYTYFLAFCFFLSKDVNPAPNPAGATFAVFPFSEVPFFSSTFASPFSPLFLEDSAVPGLMSWAICGGTWTPLWGRTSSPLAAAFFLTSAAARAALSSKPLPRGWASPRTAALDLSAAAASLNACIRSGRACLIPIL